MADVMFVAITVVFFVLAAGLVHACDRIIGPDEAVDVDDVDGSAQEVGGGEPAPGVVAR